MMVKKTQDKTAQPKGTKVQGEGDYEAARRYNEKTQEHAQSGEADQAAKDAEPASRGEKRELEKAEQEGRDRAKEEDPLLEHPDRISKEGK
jgi:hypothetical protein